MRIVNFRFPIAHFDCGPSPDIHVGRTACPAAPRCARTAMLWVAVVLVFLPSCQRETKDQKSPTGTPVTRTAQEGPVTLSLTVQPAELLFTERAALTVEAVAEKGVTVNLADYESVIEPGDQQFEYRLRRVSQAAAVPSPDGKLRWTQKYEIEFFLPGEYELPSAKLTFTEVSAQPQDKSIKDAVSAVTSPPRELTTEVLKVVARPTQAAELAPEELKKIQVLPPVELQEPMSRWWLVAILAGFAVAAIALLLLRRRKREQALIAEIISAHDWARRQIGALVADDLIARGQVQEFYYRISAIVRGYIERRYGVSAPEMTTEEFLAATAGDFRFAAGPATELQGFMTACDLVKYARHRPAAGEWNDLLRTAAQFVERTREDMERSTGDEAATLTGAAT